MDQAKTQTRQASTRSLRPDDAANQISVKQTDTRPSKKAAPVRVGASTPSHVRAAMRFQMVWKSPTRRKAGRLDFGIASVAEAMPPRTRRRASTCAYDQGAQVCEAC